VPRPSKKTKPKRPAKRGPLSNPRYEAFAKFVAQGKSKREAAIAAGYSESSASTVGGNLWKKVDINRRIGELSAQVTEAFVEKTTQLVDLQIATALRRVHALDARWHKLQQVIAERADDPSMAKVPGGTTGLLVREIRSVGSGPTAKLIPEYNLDAALLKEMRAHEQQAAQELGQWPAKVDDKTIDVTKIQYQWVVPEPEDSDESVTSKAASEKNVKPGAVLQ
jgi:hypothetical protein